MIGFTSNTTLPNDVKFWCYKDKKWYNNFNFGNFPQIVEVSGGEACWINGFIDRDLSIKNDTYEWNEGWNFVTPIYEDWNLDDKFKDNAIGLRYENEEWKIWNYDVNLSNFSILKIGEGGLFYIPRIDIKINNLPLFCKNGECSKIITKNIDYKFKLKYNGINKISFGFNLYRYSNDMKEILLSKKNIHSILFIIRVSELNNINLHRGFQLGDQYLINIAKILRKIEDRFEKATVYRINGSDFAIIGEQMCIRDSKKIAEELTCSFSTYQRAEELDNVAHIGISPIMKNDKVEHIWLTEPSSDEQGNIYGVIGNEPIDVSNISINEKIGITKEYLSDWMIIENGRLIGGYTIRAIREGLKGKELENFDKNLGGIFIDEGEDYFLSNFNTPEGAILSIEDAYDSKDIEKAISCKNFEKEAELMLKNTVKIDIDKDLINKTAEVLKLSFIKSIQENGFPNFEGVKRVFKRNFISPEHCIVTEICIYPDGNKSSEKLNTFKKDNEWKVLNPAE